jgi:mRNA-degrading endonuclease RelE of RelBE toxin-antitoxin system
VAYFPLQTPRFTRIRKKLPPALREAVDREVKRVCDCPSLGEAKKGDLQGVRVDKFSFVGQLYLLADWVDDGAKTVTFLAVGGHESFYRDLKRYVK